MVIAGKVRLSWRVPAAGSWSRAAVTLQVLLPAGGRQAHPGSVRAAVPLACAFFALFFLAVLADTAGATHPVYAYGNGTVNITITYSIPIFGIYSIEILNITDCMGNVQLVTTTVCGPSGPSPRTCSLLFDPPDKGPGCNWTVYTKGCDDRPPDSRQCTVNSDSGLVVIRSSTLKPDAAITLEAWVKSAAVNPYGYVISEPQNVSFNNDYLLLANSSAVLFGVTTAGTGWASVADASANGDAWRHVVGTYDGASLALYVDGIKLKAASASGNITYSGSGVYAKTYIGSWNGTAPGQFNGTIDEVRIFNRALSPEEVNASYHSGIFRLYHNFTGLVEGNYSFSAYAQDLAGNVNGTETRMLGVDLTPPSVQLQSPQAGVYFFENQSMINISVNFTAYDLLSGIGSCWYVLTNSSGTFSVPLPGCQNTTITSPTVGGNSIRVWANDSAGNLNSSAQVNFTVRIPCANATLSYSLFNETAGNYTAFLNVTAGRALVSCTAYVVLFLPNTNPGQPETGSGFNATGGWSSSRQPDDSASLNVSGEYTGFVYWWDFSFDGVENVSISVNVSGYNDFSTSEIFAGVDPFFSEADANTRLAEMGARPMEQHGFWHRLESSLEYVLAGLKYAFVYAGRVFAG